MSKFFFGVKFILGRHFSYIFLISSEFTVELQPMWPTGLTRTPYLPI